MTQPPAVGGWAYWMLSDPKQRSMVPALDSARTPAAATAAPTTTQSATSRADLARRRRDQRAGNRDDDDRLLVEVNQPTHEVRAPPHGSGDARMRDRADRQRQRDRGQAPGKAQQCRDQPAPARYGRVVRLT